jgi:hypothetical protein
MFANVRGFQLAGQEFLAEQRRTSMPSAVDTSAEAAQ